MGEAPPAPRQNAPSQPQPNFDPNKSAYMWSTAEATTDCRTKSQCPFTRHSLPPSWLMLLFAQPTPLTTPNVVCPTSTYVILFCCNIIVVFEWWESCVLINIVVKILNSRFSLLIRYFEFCVDWGYMWLEKNYSIVPKYLCCCNVVKG